MPNTQWVPPLDTREQPSPSEGMDPGSVSYDADSLSLHASEEDVSELGLSQRSLVSQGQAGRGPFPQATASAPSAPPAEARGDLPAHRRTIPEEELFPPPPAFPRLPSQENVRQWLDSVQTLLELDFESGAPAEPTPHHQRRLMVGAVESVDPTPRFPLEPSVGRRLQAWARSPASDWTSFPRDLDRLVRVTERDYQDFVRTPPIPEEVFALLHQPPSGTARAVAGEGGRGHRLRDPALRHREDTFRALDRAVKTAVKFQGLVLWLSECVLRTLETGSAPGERTESLLQGISGMADATIGQLARVSARIGTERRENVLPLLGLGEATVADLRRLPQEGPDLFAGHFGEVVARQAQRQDALRKTQKLLDRTRPGPSTKPAASARGGRFSRTARGGRRVRRGGGGGRQRARGTFPPSAGQVTVTGGGRRTFTPGERSNPPTSSQRRL